MHIQYTVMMQVKCKLNELFSLAQTGLLGSVSEVTYGSLIKIKNKLSLTPDACVHAVYL